jgi:hypothetical protein
MRKPEEGGRKGFSGFEISKLGGDETPQDPNRGKAVPVCDYCLDSLDYSGIQVALPITRTQVTPPRKRINLRTL